MAKNAVVLKEANTTHVLGYMPVGQRSTHHSFAEPSSRASTIS
jgi:hypothetical protein